VVNDEDASYIFTAQQDQQKGITLRHPAGARLGMAHVLYSAMSRANLAARMVEFPKGGKYTFVQVEIGDWDGAAQWDD
jgi:hypothetical protein